MYALAILLEGLWALMKASYRAVHKLVHHAVLCVRMVRRKGADAEYQAPVRHRDMVVARLIAHAWPVPKSAKRNVIDTKEESCKNEVLVVPLLVWSC
jgi:enhancing lycopene biosynthesis protein 2